MYRLMEDHVSELTGLNMKDRGQPQEGQQMEEEVCLLTGGMSDTVSMFVQVARIASSSGLPSFARWTRRPSKR